MDNQLGGRRNLALPPRTRGSAGYTARIANHFWRRRSPSPQGESQVRERDKHGLTTLTDAERAIVAEAQPFTLTTTERLLATMDAVTYVVDRDIPGSLAECGVWKGGSILAMVRVLQGLGVDDRDVYLLDTFDGMTRPTEADTSSFDEPALVTWDRSTAGGAKPWAWVFDDQAFNLEGVQELIRATGYPRDRVHFVVGQVEETLPEQAPDRLSLLRLDTDWYESTRHELVHLYPRLASGGVLIIDDYGHWDGARKAVDEYFADIPRPLLSRIDYTGRIGIKP